MKDIIWLFPLLFIFHDLEEIIGFIPWLQRNERLLAKKATAKDPQRLIHRRVRTSCGRGICRGALCRFLGSFLPYSLPLPHLVGWIRRFRSSSGASYPASYLA